MSKVQAEFVVDIPDELMAAGGYEKSFDGRQKFIMDHFINPGMLVVIRMSEQHGSGDSVLSEDAYNRLRQLTDLYRNSKLTLTHKEPSSLIMP